MNSFAPYQAATGCTKYGPQGAQALTTYTEDVFEALHRLMGICNCRSVVGGSSWSHHAECRAADNGFTIVKNQPWGYQFALILAEHGAEVGLDHIITNARPWESGRGAPLVFSARSPNGRTYTGTHPHKDHNHNGLTRNAGRNLTYATLVHVYGPPEAAARRLMLATTTEGEQVLDRNTPSPSSAVAMFQRDLIHLGFDIGDADSIQPSLYPPGADGDFGSKSEAGCIAFQRYIDIAATGKADGLTVALAANLARFAEHPRTTGGKIKAASGGGVTEAEVDSKIAAHATSRASASVHPHAHDEGKTAGPT